MIASSSAIRLRGVEHIVHTEARRLGETHLGDEITEEVIGGAIDVHRALGPGLLESVYQTCMLMELTDRGLGVEAKKVLPAFYKRRQIDCVYRTDIIVEGRVVVELKSVNQLEPVTPLNC